MKDRDLIDDNFNKKWEEFDEILGYKKYEFSFNVFKFIKWVKNLGGDDKKINMKNEWVYECGCTAIPEAYRTMPYCPIHGMKLIIKEGV